MEKKNKNKIVGIRFTDKEKKCIEVKAEKLNMTLSEYIRDIVLYDKKKITNDMDKQKVMTMAAQAQEIANYVGEKYVEDEILEKKVKKLWKSLS